VRKSLPGVTLVPDLSAAIEALREWRRQSTPAVDSVASGSVRSGTP